MSSQDEAGEMGDVYEMIHPPPECVKEMKLQAVRDLEESATLLVIKTL